jgi:phosphatidylinositol glycan class P protein
VGFAALTKQPLIERMMGEVDNSSLSPPQTSQVKASEFYGFVAWIATSLAFVLFILWSFLPDEWIHWTGVHWYPSRYVLK